MLRPSSLARLAMLLGLALAAGRQPAAAGPLWRPCTLDELVSASDLVVVGRIVAVERAAPGPDATDRAELVVERVLAGAAGQDPVVLAFPGVARSDPDPGVVRYELDQEGIFFLRRRGDGTYSANHPARFKPRFFLADLEAFLARAG